MNSLLVAIALLATLIHGKQVQEVAEYEIQQGKSLACVAGRRGRSWLTSGLLSGGRSYEIKSKTNAASRFTIRNELFSIGKKLYLLEDGKERFAVRHHRSSKNRRSLH